MCERGSGGRGEGQVEDAALGRCCAVVARSRSRGPCPACARPRICQAPRLHPNSPHTTIPHTTTPQVYQRVLAGSEGYRGRDFSRALWGLASLKYYEAAELQVSATGGVPRVCTCGLGAIACARCGGWLVSNSYEAAELLPLASNRSDAHCVSPPPPPPAIMHTAGPHRSFQAAAEPAAGA